MDAVIIYLKDGVTGNVEASMEIIGYPERALIIGSALMNSITLLPKTDVFAENEFTQLPPDLMQ